MSKGTSGLYSCIFMPLEIYQQLLDSGYAAEKMEIHSR